MNRLAIFLGLLLLAAPARAQEPRIEGFEIVSVGTYEVDMAPGERDSQGVLQHIVSNERQTAATTSIPVRVGVTFGIQYRVTGAPDGAAIPVRHVYRFPYPGARPPGSPAPLRANSADYGATLNGTSVATYTLEEPWELLPGRWVLEIWAGDRRLGEQAFTLVGDYAER